MIMHVFASCLDIMNDVVGKSCFRTVNNESLLLDLNYRGRNTK